MTVIYYAPNPQIWYIEMVGARSTLDKKKRTVIVANSVQYMRRVYLSTSSEASDLPNVGRASFRKFENTVVLQGWHSDALYILNEHITEFLKYVIWVRLVYGGGVIFVNTGAGRLPRGAAGDNTHLRPVADSTRGRVSVRAIGSAVVLSLR